MERLMFTNRHITYQSEFLLAKMPSSDGVVEFWAVFAWFGTALNVLMFIAPAQVVLAVWRREVNIRLPNGVQPKGRLLLSTRP